MLNPIQGAQVLDRQTQHANKVLKNTFCINGQSVLDSEFNQDAYLENDNAAKIAYGNVKVLSRVVNAIRLGRIRVNGEPADNRHSLGEYIMHGGQVRFNLSKLKKENQQKFWDYLFQPTDVPSEANVASEEKGQKKFWNYLFPSKNSLEKPYIYKRWGATHFINGRDAKGEPRETKSYFLGNIVNFLLSPFMRVYSGMDLPIGGYNLNPKAGIVKADGQWGKMSICRSPNGKAIMIGVQPSASFALPKIDELAPKDKKDPKDLLNLLGREENGVSVTIGDEDFKKMLAQPLEERHLTEVPQHAEDIQNSDDRFKKMKIFQEVNDKLPTSQTEYRLTYGGIATLVFIALLLIVLLLIPGGQVAIIAPIVGLLFTTVSPLTTALTGLLLGSFVAIIGTLIGQVKHFHKQLGAERYGGERRAEMKMEKQALQNFIDVPTPSHSIPQRVYSEFAGYQPGAVSESDFISLPERYQPKVVSTEEHVDNQFDKDNEEAVSDFISLTIAPYEAPDNNQSNVDNSLVSRKYSRK